MFDCIYCERWWLCLYCADPGAQMCLRVWIYFFRIFFCALSAFSPDTLYWYRDSRWFELYVFSLTVVYMTSRYNDLFVPMICTREMKDSFCLLVFFFPKKKKKKRFDIPREFQGNGLLGKLFAWNFKRYLLDITKTRMYNYDPLQPHFYIVKLGSTGVYIIFLISAQRHRLWVLVRTAWNMKYGQKYEKFQTFLSENFSFFGSKILNIFE